MSAQGPVLPYGRQWIDDDDVRAVVECLRGDWLTQGPTIERFEAALCAATGARYAVAVSSGTAALHLAAKTLGVKAGDTGLVPAITFAASANCLAYVGGKVDFVDVDPDTALIDLKSLEQKIAALTAAGTPPRAIVAVDMCGQIADLPGIQKRAAATKTPVIEDAAHSLGGWYEHNGTRYRAGCCVHTDAAILSFHPVKHITTAEGGAMLTNDAAVAQHARDLRSHGIHRDAARYEHTGEGPWYYEQAELGYHYRITDLQCALGLTQAAKLERFVARRREIAAQYDAAFASRLAAVARPVVQKANQGNAYHLYVIRLAAKAGEDLKKIAQRRAELYQFLRGKSIYTQVHYVPVNWQPYYRHNHGTTFTDCPGANAYYAGCLSLPMFPAMKDADVERVVAAIEEWAVHNT